MCDTQHQFSKKYEQKWRTNARRRAYERMEKQHVTCGLDANEITFIADQDHFFMASIGENGYPYIQHRGGPPGFVKVLDPKTLAFVDFTGNKQYISGSILLRWKQKSET